MNCTLGLIENSITSPYSDFQILVFIKERLTFSLIEYIIKFPIGDYRIQLQFWPCIYILNSILWDIGFSEGVCQCKGMHGAENHECVVWYCEAEVTGLPSHREITVVMWRACGQAQWYISAVPVLGSQRWEGGELLASEDFIGRPFQTQPRSKKQDCSCVDFLRGECYKDREADFLNLRHGAVKSLPGDYLTNHLDFWVLRE